MTNLAISDEDYKQHVVIIWKTFAMKNMKNYLFLESIVSFESDPTLYLSAHVYNGDAMLRYTGVALKLISDMEKYQFIESMIMGGISMISEGYVEANNNFLKSIHPNKLTLYIKYLDANTLYGHSMIQLFPNEILDWVNSEKFN